MRGRVRGKRPEARVVGGVIALQSLCIQENKGESAPNTEIGERLNTSAYFSLSVKSTAMTISISGYFGGCAVLALVFKDEWMGHRTHRPLLLARSRNHAMYLKAFLPPAQEGENLRRINHINCSFGG